jgi:hypothetical protein
MPRGSEFNPAGISWAIEGNTLAFRPFPPINDTDWILYYVPSADFKPHYSTGGAVNSGDAADTFRLAPSLGNNDIGEIDNRDNAYVGQVLRVITSTKVIERIIDAHSYNASLGLWTVHTRVSLGGLAAARLEPACPEGHRVDGWGRVLPVGSHPGHRGVGCGLRAGRPAQCRRACGWRSYCPAG